MPQPVIAYPSTECVEQPALLTMALAVLYAPIRGRGAWKVPGINGLTDAVPSITNESLSNTNHPVSHQRLMR